MGIRTGMQVQGCRDGYVCIGQTSTAFLWLHDQWGLGARNMFSTARTHAASKSEVQQVYRHEPAYGARHLKRKRWLGLRLAAVAGVDFGTTHSTISVARDREVKSVPVAENDSVLLPSTVCYSADSDPVVGLMRGSQATNSVTFIDNIKRLLGREYHDCLTHQLGYETVPMYDGKVGIQCQHTSGPVSMAEVASEILKALKSCAEKYLGESIDRVVMTVPSKYSKEQRLATMDAAALCGISRVSLLQEPVAAAMAHGLGKPSQEEPAILVVDVGGGTCDISLLQSFEGLLEVVGYDGDSQLGGVDLDEAIMHHWATMQPAVASSIEGVKKQDAKRWVRWRAEAERCKIALSTQSSCTVTLERLDGTSCFPMTRADLQKAAQPFLDRLGVPLQRLAQSHSLAFGCASEMPHEQIQGAGKFAPPPRLVTQLILVGGVTESPVVRDYIEQLVRCKCCELEGESRSCVSRGAAMHAGIMMGDLPGGLELSDGLYVQDLQSRTSGFQS